MGQYDSIVILTGAGASAESGIQTFRDSNGLWREHSIEKVASPSGFETNPDLVHEFYNQRRAQLLSSEVKENAGHIALARLEKEFDGEFILVTQNVDDLHERAGSVTPIHMHGEILKKRCTNCDDVSEIRGDIWSSDVCDYCETTGTLRPHIVWFGEMPHEMERIQHSLRTCDLFVSIGTSGHVYPAAGFAAIASQAGAKTIQLNLEPSENANAFDESQYGLATELVPKFVDQLLKS